ncbi:MAG: NTP transferase domain-containing protein [Candidatus Omnitrophota bacterium]|nr:NTP transferase domain-containing protein [Candidatus Omnitrophota bacterium]
MNKNFKVIILAAGKGVRMNSELPKVMQPICGKPMLEFVLDNVKVLKLKDITLVLGFRADLVRAILDKDIKIVMQKKLLGTGDAVKIALAKLKGFKGSCLILNGDNPLVNAKSMHNLMKAHIQSGASATFLTANVDNPHGFGRVVRDNYSRVTKISEDIDAGGLQRQINEINAGVYCFKAPELLKALNKIKPKNKKKEFYLTDIIETFLNEGFKIETVTAEDKFEALGINTRCDLALANEIMRTRILNEHMERGVTIISPEMTFIYPHVSIGRDTIIYPFTVIESDVIIGKNCSIGPFCHLRPGTKVEDSVVLGNFVEVSRSKIGKDTLAKHFSFLGDAQVGKKVNIGAGVVTANFDGENKNITKIDDEALIGSDTILVAPVRIGKKAITGAGCVVTKHKDVPSGKVALGVPARIVKKKNK